MSGSVVWQGPFVTFARLKEYKFVKILHVVHGYPPSIGGSQWLTKMLSEHLVAQYQDEVTVFTTVAYHMEYFWKGKQVDTTPPPLAPSRKLGGGWGRGLGEGERETMPAGTEIVNGVTVRRFPVFNGLSKLRMVLAGIAYRLRLPFNDWLRTLYTGPIIPGLARAIAESGADVVFGTAFPLLHMYYAVAGARRAGIPVVLLGAIHTADTWGYKRPMIYRAIQRADAYIAHTTFERDYLIARGIAAEKISVIGAGVDAEAFVNADGATIRERYGWENDPVIATLGKQTPRKRFDTLLQAMPRVWETYPNARLLIAGSRGPDTPKIQQAIQTFPRERQKQIRIVSDFPDADKPLLLAACDVFALPSGQESFGIAFVEAWACGKPVIGARTGAIPAVIAEGEDGLLATYGDPEDFAQAILALLNDPQRRIAMGKAGQAKVLEKYTWDIVTDSVRGVYEQVCR